MTPFEALGKGLKPGFCNPQKIALQFQSGAKILATCGFNLTPCGSGCELDIF
jgi:hypothetical protein